MILPERKWGKKRLHTFLSHESWVIEKEAERFVKKDILLIKTKTKGTVN